MLTLLILFLGVVVAAAIFSMAEAAILSLPLVRARILVEQKYKNAKDILYLKENITLTVASVVVVNNVITIVGSIFIGELFSRQFGNEWLGLASTVVTFTIIVASEVIPKAIGEQYKVSLSSFFAKPLRILLWIFRPFVHSLIQMTRPFVQHAHVPKVTEEEIKMMLKLGRDAGTVELDEEVLCNRVFKLNDLRAYQIMKPIDEIFAIPGGKTVGELRETIIESRYSRIAVYDKDPKNFVGIVEHRVLLREIAKDNDQVLVQAFMTKPIFVNWFMKGDELLERFQAYNQHLFIVQDLDGRNAGLVTMEDVLEELFGEIYDERDMQLRKKRGLTS